MSETIKPFVLKITLKKSFAYFNQNESLFLDIICDNNFEIIT